jgi:hypothetical protein
MPLLTDRDTTTGPTKTDTYRRGGSASRAHHLRPLADVGLSSISLGQTLTMPSGGEHQCLTMAFRMASVSRLAARTVKKRSGYALHERAADRRPSRA